MIIFERVVYDGRRVTDSGGPQTICDCFKYCDLWTRRRVARWLKDGAIPLVLYFPGERVTLSKINWLNLYDQSQGRLYWDWLVRQEKHG